MRKSLAESRGLLWQLLLSGMMKGGGGLLTFVCFIFIARSAAVDEYGLFSIAFSSASLLCYVMVGGQHTAILKFYPRVNDPGPISPAGKSVILRSLRILGRLTLATSAIILGGWFVARWAGPPMTSGATFSLVAFTLFLSALLGLAEFFSSLFRARGQTLAGLWPRDLLWRLLMIAVFGLILWLNAPGKLRANLFSAGELAGIVAGLLAAALSIQVARLARDMSKVEKARDPFPGHLGADMQRSFRSFWALGFLWPARGQLGTIIVGLMINPAAAGAFFSAQRLAAVLLMVSVAINTAVGPEISRALAANDLHKAKRVFMTGSLVAGSASAAFMLLLVAVGDDLLALFDPSYRSFTPVLLMFAIGQAVFNACGPLGVFLTLAERERTVLLAGVVATIATLVGVVILTRLYGPIGAATAIAGVTVLLNLYLATVAWSVFRGSQRKAEGGGV